MWFKTQLDAKCAQFWWLSKIPQTIKYFVFQYEGSRSLFKAPRYGWATCFFCASPYHWRTRAHPTTPGGRVASWQAGSWWNRSQWGGPPRSPGEERGWLQEKSSIRRAKPAQELQGLPSNNWTELNWIWESKDQKHAERRQPADLPQWAWRDTILQ